MRAAGTYCRAVYNVTDVQNGLQAAVTPSHREHIASTLKPSCARAKE